MKLVGFIKEHDDIETSVPYEIFKKGQILDPELKNDILNHLELGVVIVAFMGMVKTLDGRTYIPMGYDSDGYWVWPGYFKYYVEREISCNINPEFISYIQNKKSIRIAPFDEKKMEEDFLKILDK